MSSFRNSLNFLNIILRKINLRLETLTLDTQDEKRLLAVDSGGQF